MPTQYIFVWIEREIPDGSLANVSGNLWDAPSVQPIEAPFGKLGAVQLFIDAARLDRVRPVAKPQA